MSEKSVPRKPSGINIRNLSVKCGRCDQYQVLIAYEPLDEDWNQYIYECDWSPCNDDPEASRTLLEIPTALDAFARRDPTWHGGERHAGATHGEGHDDDSGAEAEAGTEPVGS